MPISVNGANGITFSDGSIQNTGAAGFGFKNRIINGAMVIDQRNNGAATTTHVSYPVDRWCIIKDTSSGSFTIQQSSTAPAGFAKSLVFTVGTAYTPSSGENNFLKHLIEGYNVSDLNWGTANAATVTLSFWVRSSLTGTFGGSVRNGGSDRSYPFSYSISAANAFEYKSITIPGDTSGTWNITNGNGVEISWGLSVGSSYSGTANAWVGSNKISTTGATNLTSTAGATFYITGVQFEKGSTATSFDWRPHSHELMLCQRYFSKSFPTSVVPAYNTESGTAIYAFGGRMQVADVMGLRTQQIFHPVPMRTAPTITMYNPNGASGTANYFTESAAAQNPASPGPYIGSEYSFAIWQYTGVSVGGTGTLVLCIFHYTASAEL
jgi:hypothetical protein